MAALPEILLARSFKGQTELKTSEILRSLCQRTRGRHSTNAITQLSLVRDNCLCSLLLQLAYLVSCDVASLGPEAVLPSPNERNYCKEMAKEILCQFLIEPDGKRKGDRLWEHEKEAHTLSPFHKILSPRSDRKFPLATSNLFY